MAFENRKYVIIPSTEINNINFEEVLETAPDTCRYSVDGTKTFVKYEGNQPASVSAITGKSQEYSHDEILVILETAEWTVNENLEDM
jgi:hypothetical protein